MEVCTCRFSPSPGNWQAGLAQASRQRLRGGCPVAYMTSRDFPGEENQGLRRKAGVFCP